ncbi:MAG: hypothetical protein WDM77_12810 [Steroidobacteraceae bacterium]
MPSAHTADQRDRDRAQPNAMHRTKLEATAAGAAHIFNVAALVLVVHVHGVARC